MYTLTPFARFVRLCAVLVLMAGWHYSAAAQESGSGKLFWIAVPPNSTGDHPTSELAIYVTSAFNTRVTLSYPGSWFTMTKDVIAGQVTVFSTADGSANWGWEIQESEKVVEQGIMIEAEHPVSVSVLNSKPVTAEGYRAIPVEAWRTQYMHLGFYDFNEASMNLGGGFVVIASDDNTKVNFKLDGVDRSGAAGKTARGREIGTVVSVTLNRGQVYMVEGNGGTLGEFDLSGTLITASKPVGFLSFHRRTMIPAFPAPNNGRDHLVEMLPPITSWGTEHVSVEFPRDSNRGDFFRIIAAESNTNFTCRYTDHNGEVYTWSGTLKEAGDFAEKDHSWPPVPAVTGAAVWTSDKPTLVMQYAYSQTWDNAAGWDPLMVQVVPTTQYTRSAQFAVASGELFPVSYLSLIAEGNPNDDEQTLLKSIKLDGVPLHTLDPSFTENRIQDSRYYWIRVPVTPGAHTLTGLTAFGATVYGIDPSSVFSAYGWVAAATLGAVPTDVSDAAGAVGFAVTTAPNPAVDAVRARWTMPMAGAVRMELVNTAGERVAVLLDERVEAGAVEREVSVAGLPSGVYLCRLSTPAGSATTTVTLVR